MIINKFKSGSALLVAVLVMGILVTITLGISSLVVSEIRQTGDVVIAGKAYFGAEAGIEHALFELSENLPGYETDISPGVLVDEDDISFRYEIKNKGDMIPYFADDEPVFLGPDDAIPKGFLYQEKPKYTYNVLGLNETVTIPLFTDDGTDNFEDVNDFMVQYYVDFDLDPNIDSFGGQQLVVENFDVLRWKLFGNPSGDSMKTDAISDFYPAHSNDGPKNPVCIGSASSLQSSPENVYDYDCIVPVAQDEVGGEIVNTWSSARVCYKTEAGTNVSGGQNVKSDGCTIKSFMDNHDRNYITLTNVVNPDIVGISNIELRNSRANIYYRIVASKNTAGENNLVRDFADIKSDGYARNGEVKQSIDVKLKMSSFLPVFTFSLYRTDTEDDIKDAPPLTKLEKVEPSLIPNFL